MEALLALLTPKKLILLLIVAAAVWVLWRLCLLYERNAQNEAEQSLRAIDFDEYEH